MDMKELFTDTFPSITEPELQNLILNLGQVMTFRPGQIIIDYGQYIRFVPLVLEGSVKVMRMNPDGKEIILYYLIPGETCSLTFSCCLTQKQSEVRTEAEEKTIILGIPFQYMDEWFGKYVSWKNFILGTMEDRMNKLLQTIDSIAFKKMDERLLLYLKEKAVATNSFIITSSHQQIADDLHASREAISRLLKIMENEGLIKLGRNRIELTKQLF